MSAASSWEIAIECGLGKLVLPEPPAHYVPERLRLLGAIGIPVEHAHALAVASLPPLHRDPFDRLLVARAQVLGIRIVTADPAVARYPVSSLLVGTSLGRRVNGSRATPAPAGRRARPPPALR